MHFGVVDFLNTFSFILWRSQAFAKRHVKISIGEAGTPILNYHESSLQVPPVVATLYALSMHSHRSVGNSEF